MPWVSLIGFMCSGKSSTGRALARKLGWEHHDTDAVIVERAGMSVDRIFRTQGEEVFRRMEREVVEELPPERDLVLSTGGGLVLSAPTMGILNVQGPIFWLHVGRDDVLDRCTRPWAAKRPLLNEGEDLPQRIDRLMAERDPFYRQYGIPIEGGFSHPGEAGRHILEVLRNRDEFRVYFGRGEGVG